MIFPHLFTAKVRGFIICQECGKRRCIYCDAVLSLTTNLAIERLQDDLIYTCGDSLFREQTVPTAQVVVVRVGVNCLSPVEVTYFSGIKQYNSINIRCFN